MSNKPIHEVIAEISAKVPADEWAKLGKTHYADPDTIATLSRLERENADLRHDIERHVKIAADLATELARAQHDLITLCLRLYLEPNDSHSPDTADVLNRWRKAWEAAAAGEPIFSAIDAAIAAGKGEK